MRNSTRLLAILTACLLVNAALCLAAVLYASSRWYVAAYALFAGFISCCYRDAFAIRARETERLRRQSARRCPGLGGACMMSEGHAGPHFSEVAGGGILGGSVR